MRGLFWNIYRKNLFEPLIEIIKENRIEIVVLAEAEKLNITRFCNELSKLGLDFKETTSIKNNPRIKIIYEQNRFEQEILQENRYWSISRFFNNIKEYILVGLHLPVINMNEADKALITRRLLSDIIEVENRMKHDRTILVGDFNSNPFDDGLLNIDGICGLPIKDYAMLNSRVYKDEEYKLFYNPSWLLLNPQKQPYGTYFKYPEHTKTLYWHVLDQVILRPNLIEEFMQDELKVIIETTSHHLLKNNKPNKDMYSDHLPIIFTFK